jgi:hypothetical protein
MVSKRIEKRDHESLGVRRSGKHESQSRYHKKVEEHEPRKRRREMGNTSPRRKNGEHEPRGRKNPGPMKGEMEGGCRKGETNAVSRLEGRAVPGTQI